MSSEGQAPDLAATGVISRSPPEIARVLGALAAHGATLRSSIAEGGLLFESRLQHVDPAHGFILLEPCASESANAALLTRPRASFHASTGGWHIEFAASGPRLAQHEGRQVIRLAFPEVLVSQQRRAHERVSVQPQAPLHFVADAGGVISFEGAMVDISAGGIGFLQYAPDITLEPGTILRGCRIEPPGREALEVDLEVRYSVPVTLPDGRQVHHSGCRFVDPSAEVRALLEAYFSR